MSLAIVNSRATKAMSAPQVTIEVHLSNGLPGLSIVGLPETAVKKSKDRVRSAILNSGYIFPSKRITINLAPADLPKEGGRFDLPIALGILKASGQLECKNINDFEFAGELSLTGELRKVSGILPFALQTNKKNKILCIPVGNSEESGFVSDLKIISISNLISIVNHLNGNAVIPHFVSNILTEISKYTEDLSDVKGQYQAKRALMIAAAGGHNLLFIGPPGTGKTMLATRLNTIMPPLSQQEALDVASINSIKGHPKKTCDFFKRPFRSPHHTTSAVALVGGGSNIKPGEISLAHNGVLFLDEFPEFDRRVLEVLRQPLESGTVTISRANSSADFPAGFQLISAMNPCPYGYLGSQTKSCTDSPSSIARYQSKLSGPLLDRIDLQVEVVDLKKGALSEKSKLEDKSEYVRGFVIKARNLQILRQGVSNSQLSNKGIEKYCSLDKETQTFLEDTMEKLKFSARSYHRILKISRTIADLKNNEDISRNDIIESLNYRKMDRFLQK